MIAKLFVGVSIAFVAASCVCAATPGPALQGSAPVYSTLGFSFRPPGGTDWTESFGRNQISYTKTTDPRLLTFYTGVLEVKLSTPLPDAEALLAFVRKEKDQWGSDGRFTDISSRFFAEPAHGSCVRYRIQANDRAANNPAGRQLMFMQVSGRFCTHPHNPETAVDIFYSVRHVPGYDVETLNAEGDAFLEGLAFHRPGISPSK